jgi:hypothetical protein
MQNLVKVTTEYAVSHKSTKYTKLVKYKNIILILQTVFKYYTIQLIMSLRVIF